MRSVIVADGDSTAGCAAVRDVAAGGTLLPRPGSVADVTRAASCVMARRALRRRRPGRPPRPGRDG